MRIGVMGGGGPAGSAVASRLAIEACATVLLQPDVRYKTRVAPKPTGIQTTVEAPVGNKSDADAVVF
jgi:hypothetical protein